MQAFQDTPIMLVGKMNIIEDDVETEVIASEDYCEATHRGIKFIESLGHGGVEAWQVPRTKLN